MVKVAIDSNEKSFFIEKQLKKLDAEVLKTSLPIGDYAVSEDTIIERKTVADFLSSISDGRLFNQINAMKKNFDNPVLIIEGHESIYQKNKVHEDGVRGVISKITLDFKVPIIRTHGEEDTAKYIYSLAKRKQNNGSVTLRLGRRKGECSPENVLGSLPGVGMRTAINLLKEFGCIENVFKADESELQKVSLVGKKKAKQIRKLLTEKYTCE